ncbi:hypothetical protein F5882DRAFT_506927 [Hyaloscypha sp. PMI_1271]|nr:hypothetical protein F5882DRAFT_506927 [Hyaloscypha sp. PMI_1271]
MDSRPGKPPTPQSSACPRRYGTDLFTQQQPQPQPPLPSLLFFSSNILPIGHPSTGIQLKIVKNLDQVSSACLGLTCKAFYPLHKELRGITPLYAWYYLAPYAMLEERLETWAGPELWYQFDTRKFWRKERVKREREVRIEVLAFRDVLRA